LEVEPVLSLAYPQKLLRIKTNLQLCTTGVEGIIIIIIIIIIIVYAKQWHTDGLA